MCLQPCFIYAFYHLRKILTNTCDIFLDNERVWLYNHFYRFGEMAEWLKAPVLKTGDVERHRGFESLSLRDISSAVEKYPSGRRGSPAKGVGWDNRRPGSNPGFSASQSLMALSFLYLVLFRFILPSEWISRYRSIQTYNTISLYSKIKFCCAHTPF